MKPFCTHSGHAQCPFANKIRIFYFTLGKDPKMMTYNVYKQMVKGSCVSAKKRCVREKYFPLSQDAEKIQDVVFHCI